VESAAAADQALPPVRWPFIAGYGFALLGAWMAIMTPATVTLALRVAQIDPLGKERNYSMVAGVGALFALGANPLFGALSDRTTSRFGMRRPWILLGATGGCIGAVMIASASHVGMIVAGWAVMQTFCNASLAALLVVISDRVPLSQRGMVSGVAGTAPTAGILAGAYLAAVLPEQDPVLLLLVPALAGLVSAVVFSGLFADRVLRTRSVAPKLGLGVPALGLASAKGRRFLLCLLALLLASSCIAVFQTYVVFFLTDYVGITVDDTTRVAFYVLAASNVAAAIVSPFAGTLSDRLKSRNAVFAVGVVTMAVGLGVMLMGRTIAGICVGSTILGIGYGIFSGLYTALVLDVVPSETSAARDLGLGNIALTLPYFIVPAVAPLLLDLGSGKNYTALFLAGISLTLLAIPLMNKVTSH
jgi:MFS family permease